MSNSVDEVVKTLVSRFTSGNEIPVRQSRILRDEWDAIRSTITAQQQRIEALEAERDEFERKADALLNHCDKEGGECSRCGEICCPHKSPMHFHHDGCPACAEFDPIDPHSST